ncbi:hypothetical protein NOK12_33880 [Nocardioides sp. OK12]|uniref:hypothetical protein n=1 Tax=Nocardioides sp. OK12 TaxID=2758661 RepID=UPI0021C3C11D|nr:hypothetical protein [Nocardioides sp. OK12]GHJ60870.1 hypothetical protein NOK12_33880 [Nocardioides sp. OK12]
MPKGTPLPQPRDWLRDDPDHNLFGRNKPVRWKSARSKSDRALVAAALTQHEFANALRAHLRNRRPPMTTSALAQHAGLTIDQLRRILRGETHMTLAHMQLLAAHAGLPLARNARTRE